MNELSSPDSDTLLLAQARYVLKNLHAERPGCGYDKLAAACDRAALRARDGAARTLDTGIENDPCPYAQDGCVLEANEIGPCLCANHVRAAGRGDAAQTAPSNTPRCEHGNPEGVCTICHMWSEVSRPHRGTL